MNKVVSTLFIVLGIFGSWPAAAKTDLCDDLVLLLPGRSEPKWIQFSSKEFKEDTLDSKIFRENLYAAVTQVFVPWFESKGKSEPYLNMLKRMHKITALGPDPLNPRSYRAVNYTSSSILPGLTRADAAKMSLTEVEKLPRSSDLTSSADWVTHARKGSMRFNPALEIFGRVDHAVFEKLTGIPNFDRANRLPQYAGEIKNLLVTLREGSASFEIPIEVVFDEDGLVKGWNMRWLLDLEGFSERLLLVVLGGGAWRIMPDASELPRFLDRAEVLVNQLLEIKPQSCLEPRFLNTLADYYQVLINSHPFVRINQSIFMAQVNSFLVINRCEPVWHGNLDRFGMALDSKPFRKYFADWVIKHQSK